MNLIDQLTQDLKPVKALPKAEMVTAVWILISGLILGGTIALFHRYRSDVEVMMHSMRFVWIFASLLFLSMLSAVMALKSAVPGKEISRLQLAMAFLFFIFALAPLMISGMEEPMEMAMSGLNPSTGWHCSLSVVAYSLLPALALFWFVQRRLASTKPLLTGSLVGLSVGALGAAVLAWTCSVNEAVHLIVWHLIPVFILSFIFAKLSQKFLSF